MTDQNNETTKTFSPQTILTQARADFRLHSEHAEQASLTDGNEGQVACGHGTVGSGSGRTKLVVAAMAKMLGIAVRQLLLVAIYSLVIPDISAFIVTTQVNQ